MLNTVKAFETLAFQPLDDGSLTEAKAWDPAEQKVQSFGWLDDGSLKASTASPRKKDSCCGKCAPGSQCGNASEFAAGRSPTTPAQGARVEPGYNISDPKLIAHNYRLTCMPYLTALCARKFTITTPISGRWYQLNKITDFVGPCIGMTPFCTERYEEVLEFAHITKKKVTEIDGLSTRKDWPGCSVKMRALNFFVPTIQGEDWYDKWKKWLNRRDKSYPVQTAAGESRVVDSDIFGRMGIGLFEGAIARSKTPDFDAMVESAIKHPHTTVSKVWREMEIDWDCCSAPNAIKIPPVGPQSNPPEESAGAVRGSYICKPGMDKREKCLPD